MRERAAAHLRGGGGLIEEVVEGERVVLEHALLVDAPPRLVQHRASAAAREHVKLRRVHLARQQRALAHADTQAAQGGSGVGWRGLRRLRLAKGRNHRPELARLVAIATLRFASAKLSDENCAHPAVVADIHTAETSLTYVDELMTNVLDLNKFLAGKIELVPERCSLLECVLRPVASMLARRDTSVVLSVATDEPLWVEVDPLRLKQVMMNLAKNAVKFVPNGFRSFRSKEQLLWNEIRSKSFRHERNSFNGIRSVPENNDFR